MANIYKTMPIGQVVAGKFEPDTSLEATLNLRVSPFTTSYKNCSGHLGNGVYAFENVAKGNVYRLYNGDTYLDKYGDITEGITLASEIPSGVDASKLADGSISNTEFQYLNGVSSNIQAQLNGKGSLAGTNFWSGINEFSSHRPKRDDAIATGSYETNTDFVCKDDLDEALSAYAVASYQQETRRRRVIANGTVCANRDYTTIPSAISSCSSPSVYNTFDIELLQGAVSGTTTDNVFYLTHSQVTNYCNLRGKSKSIKLVLGGAGQSASSNKIVTLENMIIYLGANDILTDRTYTGYKFINCTIYAYKNVTFTNCYLENCVILQPNGYGVTIDGTTEGYGIKSTNSITTTLSIDYTDGINQNYTMPTDLSLGD